MYIIARKRNVPNPVSHLRQLLVILMFLFEILHQRRNCNYLESVPLCELRTLISSCHESILIPDEFANYRGWIETGEST